MSAKNMKKIFVVLLSTLSLGLSAQNVKTISGNVTDNNGNPLEGVEVRLKNTDIFVETNSVGFYEFKNIPDTVKTIVYKHPQMEVASASIGLYNTIDIRMSEKGTTDLFELSLEDLLNLEITTTSKKAESITKSPAYFNVVTSEEIDNLNMNTLEEVLEYVTGLSTSIAEGNKFPTTTIRGNTISTYNVNTLLLFDGTPIYNPYHGSFNLATIPLGSIEQIEIVKGSNSVMYGTNAINAVINIIPKKANEDGTVVSGRVKAGSYRTATSNNAIMFKEGDFSANIFADAYRTEGQELTYLDQRDGEEFDMKKNLFTGNLASIVEWKNFKFQGLLSRIQNPVTENTQMYDLMFYKGTDTFTIPSPEVSDEFQTVVGVSYAYPFSDKVTLNAGVNFQDWILTASTPSLERIYSSRGLRGLFELDLSPFEGTSGIVGVEYNNYLGKRERKGIQNGEYVEKVDVNAGEKATKDFAVYLNGNTRLMDDKLGVHYGIRYYSSNYDGNSSTNTSPRLALTYQISSKIAVKGIYGQSFRVPMYYERSSEAKTSFGNPGLNPETSTSYDLVLMGQFNKLIWDIDLFYMEINDKIVRVNTAYEDSLNWANDGVEGVERWFENVSSFNYSGIEANAKYNFNDKLKGFFGYAFVNATNPNDDPDITGDDPWFYKHMVNFGASYKPMSIISLTTSVKYLSDFGFGELAGVSYGPIAPSYAVINLGLNIYPLPRKDFRFELKVDNITDVKIYRPEISNRKLNTAPTVPYEFGRRLSVGMSYNF